MNYEPPQYPYEYVEPSDGHRESKGCRNVVIGCLAASLILAGLATVGGIFAFRKAKSIAAEVSVKFVERAVQESELPLEQQTIIVQRFEELSQDFQEGELTFEQIGKIIERTVESRPVIAGGVEFLARKHILDKVPLSDEEKVHVERLMQRLARGIVEESIELSDFEPLKDIVLVKKGENEYVLKEDLTKEDVDKFIAELDKLVEEAGIPDEPYEVDIASELERIIDEARQE